ncbi:hypothetical protein LZ31DRAFT_305117 [Colletotrichum somersetense]|nr:hypothetical protein LZ31DRAFT_305117 [Colletotrichum somersetense]
MTLDVLLLLITLVSSLPISSTCKPPDAFVPLASGEASRVSSPATVSGKSRKTNVEFFNHLLPHRCQFRQLINLVPSAKGHTGFTPKADTHAHS